jgi:uncharacterized UBP type Zn finger protein
MTEPTEKKCTHTATIREVTPNSPDSCPQCVAMGDTWVNLRVCLACGQVGCCDSSKNKHATGHWKSSAHPIIQSYMPGQAWRWCFPDELALPDGPPLRK